MIADVLFAEQVRAALDAVLADAGLPWNQTGPDAAGSAVLYCGDVNPYLERFADLAAQGWVGQVRCVDLIVRGSDDRIASVTVEGEELPDLLRRVGAPERAVEVEAALAEQPSSALPIIRNALQAHYR